MTQDDALKILKTGANVFLTGEPGAGKTYAINEFVKYLREREVEPSITASTGIAATHIGGMTIHSWSGIGIKKFLDKYALDKISGNKAVYQRIIKAKILIIDEVSMLHADTLSMVDAVCREIKQKSAPFGGMQVVLVGDFFQLPPITAYSQEPAQLGFSKKEKFAYESGAWTKLNPVTCYITEQYRQDDPEFLSLLSGLRKNVLEPKHLAHIKARQEFDDAPKNITKLFSHNADVDRVNSDELKKISSRLEIFDMTSFGKANLVESLKKGCLSPEKLELKIGASVMFTKNNSHKGFVNGTTGTVRGFDKENNCPIVEIHSGKKIWVEPMDWNMEDNGRILAKVTQVPLRLAWAITVHKSQGMSLDRAVMDLKNVFEYGQGYVALSRVRRLSGLYLLGINDKALRVHPEVLAKDADFRQASLEAEKGFSALPLNDISAMHRNFILACNGKQ